MSFLTPELMNGTNWKAFERAIARLLISTGWENVRIVGSSGDCGADVVAMRYEDGTSRVFVVQVKSVTGANYVGPVAINEAITALNFYSANTVLVVTNGDFTTSARLREKELKAGGYDVRLWNGKFLHKLLETWKDFSPQRRELRPYQQEIVEKCISHYRNGNQRTHFVVATGLGKTVIASEILRNLLSLDIKRALVLCHSQPLALQLEKEFWGQLDSSVPTRVFFGGTPPKVHDGVNFGLYQTLTSYLSGLDEDCFDVVIVDEAHHAIAHGFSACLKHLKPKCLIGMTATPWRGDGQQLSGVFGEPISKVSLIDGMRMGYLAEVDYRLYYEKTDWQKIADQTNYRFSIGDLNKRLFITTRDEAIISELIRFYSEAGKTRTIIFCSSIEHCRRFAQLLSTIAQVPCLPISGEDNVSRNRTLSEFSTGKIQAVTAVDLLNEGIDVPEVSTLVFLRPTQSRRIFIQQLGRGLRLSPGKDRVTVLDFVTDSKINPVKVVQNESLEKIQSSNPVTVNTEPGIVTFECMEQGLFIEKWLQEAADINGSEDPQMQYPEDFF